MNPQGSAVINTSQYSKMTDRVNGAGSCKELQEISTEILTSLKAENDAIASQLAKLEPITALLTAPTSPDDLVTWVSDFIDGVLKPLYAPFTTYGTQLTARTAAITALIDDINKKASEFSSCSITLPT